MKLFYHSKSVHRKKNIVRLKKPPSLHVKNLIWLKLQWLRNTWGTNEISNVII